MRGVAVEIETPRAGISPPLGRREAAAPPSAFAEASDAGLLAGAIRLREAFGARLDVGEADPRGAGRQGDVSHLAREVRAAGDAAYAPFADAA